MDAPGAVLEEAVGEAAGGGADVEADPVERVDGEGLEGGFEFEATASDVAGFLLDGEWGVGGDLGAGFIDEAFSAADLAGEDEAFGLFAGLAKTAGG
jgi:hypothetical protein